MYHVRVLPLVPSPTYFLNNAKVSDNIIIILNNIKKRDDIIIIWTIEKEMDEQSKNKDKSIIVSGAHS